MKKEGKGFQYFKIKFHWNSETKLKESVFVGLQLQELLMKIKMN